MKMKYNFLATILLTVLLLELILRISLLFGALAYFAVIAIALIAVSRLDYQHESKKQIILLVAAICSVKAASLFLPFNLFWRTLIVYSLLAFISIFYASNLNLPRRKVKVRVFIWAAAVTVILGYAGTIVIRFERNLLLLAALPLIAFSEEYLFRGLILNSAEKEGGSEAAVVFTALLYGILCLGLGVIPALFFFAMSLLFGLLYIKTRILLFTMALNIIIHALLFLG